MKISDRTIGEGHPVFIIAEIGQNHQGSLEIAKEMILKAKEIGVDCVKFQKSCLNSKFTLEALKRPYTGYNSWGETYGEHKAYLEFSVDDYRELQQFCFEKEIFFSASAMDPVSLSHLLDLKLPFVKLGSGDANNIPLLRESIASNIPLIVSTGMQTWSQVQWIYRNLRNQSGAILHCVSAYPTPPSEALLRLIPIYMERFPEVVVGYSGHEMGIQLTVASVLLGACIVERHFTLDKSSKGTDHKASLNPEEFAKLVRYIRTIEQSEINCEVQRIPDVLSEILDKEDYDREELLLALQSTSPEDRKLLKSEIACHDKLGEPTAWIIAHVIRPSDWKESYKTVLQGRTNFDGGPCGYVNSYFQFTPSTVVCLNFQ
ncbi:sialic acid synthase isoform X2 [Toxorhynchites rutilus septentrionalis]|uniref:sialic acid synthase isoform X2 n=1 Tax=Toxorhynchites rutilus septentrionalis TaxID=329112 RepID=UPI0024785A02|nr:sialic acid synthase isoform X2 [Toxorhynchites rutilus septentrionalis]